MRANPVASSKGVCPQLEKGHVVDGIQAKEYVVDQLLPRHSPYSVSNMSDIGTCRLESTYHANIVPTLLCVTSIPRRVFDAQSIGFLDPVLRRVIMSSKEVILLNDR